MLFDENDMHQPWLGGNNSDKLPSASVLPWQRAPRLAAFVLRAQAFSSCWVGQFSFMFLNNTYNALYFALTLKKQLALIHGDTAIPWQVAPGSSVVYVIIVLCFVGSFVGLLQLCSLRWALCKYVVPDRCLRFGMNLKYSQIW